MLTRTFTPALVIARKRDGCVLSKEEIESFVYGAIDGTWESYQLSAMLMAITLKGMTESETTELTLAVLQSGKRVDLSRSKKFKIDKHSTGGVGDKISIHLAPMIAACGAAVPMISGRGLSHTGGTLDKLDSIYGFKTNLSLIEFEHQVEKIGICISGQTSEIAPVDKVLYALRDVTATVECIPLICASILGKKLAEGIDALVLDVKFGRGAFMPSVEKARVLATLMVDIGKLTGKPIRALLTSMEQPLGHSVGNALEVAESILCLKGKGPDDIMELTYALGEHMLLMAGIASTASEARAKLEATITSGTAFSLFKELVKEQGGDVRMIESPHLLPQAKYNQSILSPVDGFVKAVDPLSIALVALDLGAGRHRIEDRIDPAVGVGSIAKIGQAISQGSVVAVVYANDTSKLKDAVDRISNAFSYSKESVAKVILIEEVVGL